MQEDCFKSIKKQNNFKSLFIPSWITLRICSSKENAKRVERLIIAVSGDASNSRYPQTVAMEA